MDNKNSKNKWRKKTIEADDFDNPILIRVTHFTLILGHVLSHDDNRNITFIATATHAFRTDEAHQEMQLCSML